MQITLSKEELLKRIKETVLSIDPGATVMLYGSRARGDAKEDSDWDILVLTDQEASYAYQSSIRDALYEIELECGEMLCTAIYNRGQWIAPLTQVSPYHQNVNREGLVL